MNWIKNLFKNKENKSNWILYVIGIVLSTVFLAVLYFMLKNKGKELAKAKHALDKLQLENRRDEVEKLLQTEEKKIEEYSSKISGNKDKIEDLKIKIEKVQKEHEEISQKIQSIKNWRDIDDHINNNSHP